MSAFGTHPIFGAAIKSSSNPDRQTHPLHASSRLDRQPIVEDDKTNALATKTRLQTLIEVIDRSIHTASSLQSRASHARDCVLSCACYKTGAGDQRRYLASFRQTAGFRLPASINAHTIAGYRLVDLLSAGYILLPPTRSARPRKRCDSHITGTSSGYTRQPSAAGPAARTRLHALGPALVRRSVCLLVVPPSPSRARRPISIKKSA